VVLVALCAQGLDSMFHPSISEEDMLTIICIQIGKHINYITLLF
jgi:hypothetical protein